MQSQIITHMVVHSYRAIPVHLSQSGDWVCYVNVADYMDSLVICEPRRGKTCLCGFANNRCRAACASVQSDQHHCFAYWKILFLTGHKGTQCSSTLL